MAATPEITLYENTFGARDSSSHQELTGSTIFRIASMTKAVTSVAALQLVERGTLSLDEPVAKHLPEFEGLKVLDGFDRATGDPILRPARNPSRSGGS
jgi:Beta-lactamase class C and other penicillin binding proteins